MVWCPEGEAHLVDGVQGRTEISPVMGVHATGCRLPAYDSMQGELEGSPFGDGLKPPCGFMGERNLPLVRSGSMPWTAPRRRGCNGERAAGAPCQDVWSYHTHLAVRLRGTVWLVSDTVHLFGVLCRALAITPQ